MKETTMTALLDANVLYPAPIRDLLLHLADVKLFAPKWTEPIQDEWTRNLLFNRPQLKSKSLEATIKAMNTAFQNANVKRFHSHIGKLQLPDVDDRHVLAAAIKAKVNFIITFNLKHFPQQYINSFSIHVIHPDDFVVQLIHQKRETVLLALNNLVDNLKHPPMTREQVLNSFKKCGLTKCAELLA